ncbi:flagellar basal body rod protein FlgB [Guyparkeria hydrothermalis]|uniref:flagellar basal body rod protein FlgB n=1 Tax=Guyparkeria hydrothermalis TaxID=923 RepID=UPI002021FB0C|nr:flagellar basal body rod protein FlgB [Guyparkeria hydrothermalis]MCL7743435.1 flagellar basal body rod protein FlgB [Guyparkeria hydrothermalis]
MSIINDRLFGIHDDALKLQERSLKMRAENIANADTPGYKARVMSFDRAMEAALQSKSAPGAAGQLATSDPRQLGGTSSSSIREGFSVPDQPALDGNTVDLDKERVGYTQDAIGYQTTLSFLSSRISGIKKALGGQ